MMSYITLDLPPGLLTSETRFRDRFDQFAGPLIAVHTRGDIRLGDDSSQASACVDDRHAPDLAIAHQLDRLADIVCLETRRRLRCHGITYRGLVDRRSARKDL